MPGDRPVYTAPAISPQGSDVYVVYNAFTTPYRDDVTSPRALTGVMLHADVTGTGIGAFTEVGGRARPAILAARARTGSRPSSWATTCTPRRRGPTARASGTTRATPRPATPSRPTAPRWRGRLGRGAGRAGHLPGNVRQLRHPRPDHDRPHAIERRRPAEPARWAARPSPRSRRPPSTGWHCSDTSGPAAAESSPAPSPRPVWWRHPAPTEASSSSTCTPCGLTAVLCRTRPGPSSSSPSAGTAGSWPPRSPDGAVRLIDVASHTQLGEPIPVTATDNPTIALRPDGRALAQPSPKGLLIWDLHPAHWQTAAHLAGRDLTTGEWQIYLSTVGRYQRACPRRRLERRVRPDGVRWRHCPSGRQDSLGSNADRNARTGPPGTPLSRRAVATRLATSGRQVILPREGLTFGFVVGDTGREPVTSSVSGKII